MADRFDMVYRYVARYIQKLESNFQGSGKAAYASLRRGVGKIPGELPQLWGEIFRDLPEEFYSSNGKPTTEEWAVYTAITLYAEHQQGKDPSSSSMNKEGERLGLAVAKLCCNKDGKYTQEDRERIERRFLPMATAADMPELMHHLRGIIQLLKAGSIPLDYPQLAKDIFMYQIDTLNAGVKLAWGQDFYRNHHEDESEEDTNEQE